MGPESGRKTRKNLKQGVNGETGESSKKGNRQQEILHTQLVLRNGNHFKKSSSTRRDSHVDPESDIIFHSSNFPSSNLSLSINLSPSYSSLSINFPAASSSSLSLKIQSSPADHYESSSASSNTPPSFRYDFDQDQTLTFPVLNVIRETHPLVANSVMNTPPVNQSMDRSGGGVGEGGGYDPTRIPSTVFAREPSSGVEWSANSTDSLFSLHLGRSSSFSRDQILSFGDLSRNGEDDFAFPPPYSISVPETDYSRPSAEETNDGSIDTARKEEKEAVDEMKKDETAATDTDKEEEGKQDSIELPKHITKSLLGGEESSNSFVFPVLKDGEKGSTPVSEEQHLQTLNEQELKPFTAPPRVAKASRKSKSKCWFNCFSCSLIWSCLSCRPCTCCCCSHPCTSCWCPCSCSSHPCRTCSPSCPCSGFACHSCRCLPCVSCSCCACSRCRCSSCCACPSCCCPSCSWPSFRCCRSCCCGHRRRCC